MDIILKNKSNDDISKIKNPFMKECVDRVIIEIRNDNLKEKPIEATIWFRNGHTTAYHRVFGYDIYKVLKEVDAIIQSL